MASITQGQGSSSEPPERTSRTRDELQGPGKESGQPGPWETQCPQCPRGTVTPWWRQGVEWRCLGHPSTLSGSRCVCVPVISPPPGMGQLSTILQGAWQSAQRGRPRSRPWPPAPSASISPAAPIWGQPISPGAAQSNGKVWLMRSRKRPRLAPP